MQTTLRIDDKLYQAAKVAAASQGITLTRFLEEAIRDRLKAQPNKKRKPHYFRTYSTGKLFPFSAEEIKKIADESQLEYDLKQLDLAFGRK
ncbi:MAG: hypothetical protein HC853_13540 [Anaerolineae bacterium]|nr:hypothetical protein [Anaerolineae bacterium]